LSPLPAREHQDTDEKRKEIFWIAISFIVILGTWLAVVLIFGYQPLIRGMTYDEAVLTLGLALLMLCAVLYLVAREREQRYTNKSLLSQLQQTVSDRDDKVHDLNGLCLASAQLAGSLDVDDIAQIVADSLADNLSAIDAAVVLADRKTGRPLYLRHAHLRESADDASNPAADAAWPEDLGLNHPSPDDLEAQVRLWNEQAHLVCASHSLGNGLLGVLWARRAPDEPEFTPEHHSTAATLANMAAKAIESAQLHSELRDNYLATVRSLVCSLDARDDYAASHGQRVTDLAVRIAECMELSDAAIRDIEVFGPLHDVGKIGIPDAILLKSGPLSRKERTLCEEHCVIGERIVRPLKPGREALSLVRNHHEEWDGGGYPDGLAGEAIPQLARILKVADCYDALTIDRPYRSFLALDEVLADFRRYAGTRYDPEVVDALCAVLQEDRVLHAPVLRRSEPTGTRRQARALAVNPAGPRD